MMAGIAIRTAYGQALKALGAENPNVVVLEADVGSSTMSKLFGQAFPERYYNMGIAELGMANAAVGFSSCGLIPFVNTFATFIATRASDTVQGMIAYNHMHVVLAGAYGGLSDSFDGASHQSLTDLSFMRSLPGMTILAPSDPTLTKKAVFAAANEVDGPVYLRLSRAEMPTIYDDSIKLEVGKGIVLTKGQDITIISTGTMIHEVLKAEKLLRTQGIKATVVDMHTVKPLDRDLVIQLAEETGAVVTVEEHMTHNGLGSAVAETLCDAFPVKLSRIGLNGFAESGPYPQLLQKYGLDSECIARRCCNLLM